jgi:hypothetical protein
MDRFTRIIRVIKFIRFNAVFNLSRLLWLIVVRDIRVIRINRVVSSRGAGFTRVPGFIRVFSQLCPERIFVYYKCVLV